MLNLLNSEQTRLADQFTIQSRGMSSVDLIEAAANAFVSVFKSCYIFPDTPISIYCGTGNNGGDGLAIARLLKESGYDRLNVIIARFSLNSTADFDINLKRLNLSGIPVTEISDCISLPNESSEIIIDALLGSGLNRPLEGNFKVLVEHLNQLKRHVVSVDVPSGLPSEGVINPESTILKAELVISFQRPRINFYMPESGPFISKFRYVNIGLDEDFIEAQEGGWKLLEADDIQNIIHPRKPFTHKGTYGHALIIAGSAETMGAALLCADACLHSGAGLTTACIPQEGLTALNSRAPEVMALIRNTGEDILNADLKKYQAIAIGPGIGKDKGQAALLKNTLQSLNCPLVLDADALNILALHPGWISFLPPGTILTPHMKEFDRLFGQQKSWTERVETGRIMAIQHKLVIVLKNQYTFIIQPDGNVLINPTGNPAMATGGMGDVLTGMITAFLAQGYKAEDSALAACYIHGKAGDLLKEKGGMHCIPPRYLIRKLPEVIAAISSE